MVPIEHIYFSNKRFIFETAATRGKGIWTRAHRTPRTGPFTPFNVAGGPDRNVRLRRCRVTTVVYRFTNKLFKSADDGTLLSNSQRLLKSGGAGERQSLTSLPSTLKR